MTKAGWVVVILAVLGIGSLPFDSKDTLAILVVFFAAWSVNVYMFTYRLQLLTSALPTITEPKVVSDQLDKLYTPIPAATIPFSPFSVQVIDTPAQLAPPQAEEISYDDMKLLPFAEHTLLGLLAGAGKVLPDVLVAAMAAKDHSPQDLVKQAATVLISKYPEELKAYDGAVEGLVEHMVKQAGGPSAAVAIANDILMAENFGIEPSPAAATSPAPAELVPIAATPMIPYDQATEAAPAPVIEPATIIPAAIENAP